MRWIGDGKRRGSGWFECERCGTFDVQGWAAPHLPAEPGANPRKTPTV
jgi:hypothetical protein